MEMGNANHFITLKQINRECLVSYSKRPQKVLRWTFQASSVVFRVKMKHLTGLLWGRRSGLNSEASCSTQTRAIIICHF